MSQSHISEIKWSAFVYNEEQEEHITMIIFMFFFYILFIGIYFIPKSYLSSKNCDVFRKMHDI